MCGASNCHASCNPNSPTCTAHRLCCTGALARQICKRSPLTTAYLNRIATAVPDHDVNVRFIDFAAGLLEQDRLRSLFLRMAERSGIDHRFSVLSLNPVLPGSDEIDANLIYQRGHFPSTADRMLLFERTAPPLARRTLDRLHLTDAERRSVTHVLVTSCTGLYAPGLDFEIIDHLGLDPTVERTTVGFMGCYAAVNALKLARHIIRSEPHAHVLTLNLELCTLHFQETPNLEQVLSFLIFADGAAASLLSANPVGLALDSFRSVLIPDTKDLITWNIRGLGFDMFLSGRVPEEIARSLRESSAEITAPFTPAEIDLWAIHPGGRSVLDAVGRALDLPKPALAASREVLNCFGNMSSATVMFVLQNLMQTALPGQRGCAMAFGPGLTAETLLFHAS